jgi:hypothetical protein
MHQFTMDDGKASLLDCKFDGKRWHNLGQVDVDVTILGNIASAQAPVN